MLTSEEARAYERREVFKAVAMRRLFIPLLSAGPLSLLSNPASWHSQPDAAGAGTGLHRIAEWPGMEGTFGEHPPQPPRPKLPSFSPPRAASLGCCGFTPAHPAPRFPPEGSTSPQLLLPPPPHPPAGELLSGEPLELGSSWRFWFLQQVGRGCLVGSVGEPQARTARYSVKPPSTSHSSYQPHQTQPGPINCSVLLPEKLKCSCSSINLLDLGSCSPFPFFYLNLL